MTKPQSFGKSKRYLRPFINLSYLCVSGDISDISVDINVGVFLCRSPGL